MNLIRIALTSIERYLFRIDARIGRTHVRIAITSLSLFIFYFSMF